MRRAHAGLEHKKSSTRREATKQGELCVASEMTVKDYTDPDGWCSLGDLMRVNAGGYLFHRG
jgi:hypothetical protein